MCSLRLKFVELAPFGICHLADVTRRAYLK
jgi:hypothetical protein